MSATNGDSQENPQEREKRHLEEAVAIARGETRKQATNEHLYALYNAQEREIVRICRELHALIASTLDRR
jgi:hypothetical protein